MTYDFKQIEKKWQKKWEEAKTFLVKKSSSKKKFYCLEMFPYPSGSGLHMGHALNYTIGDIYARFKRMLGFNVLYPMGYDSFGLPAENAAIEAGEHPKKYTEKAIQNYIKQQKSLGLSYDWSKMIKTSSPEYYKWNQFFFLKFLKKGLVYRKKAPVNWCSKCNTVLANEQVHSGKCWRHEDTEVEMKQLEQWFIKTTAYADELLDKVDNLAWPERIKTMQKNWIGRSHGCEIDFEISSKDEISNVIIVHGANEDEEASKKGGAENTRHWHPWLKKQLENKDIKVSRELYLRDWNPDYNEWKNIFEKNEINENTILVGHSAGCAFILRWLIENKIKVKKVILVAPYLLKSEEFPLLDNLVDFNLNKELHKKFGELIVFYSDNDYKFILNSVNYIKKSIDGNFIEYKGAGHFCNSNGFLEFPELLNQILSNKIWPIFTTRPDTIYGVTFMVVAARHPKLFDLVTPNQKKEVEKFLKRIKSVSDKNKTDLEKDGVFTESYAIHPLTKEKVPIWAGNFVVADYGSGMVMAVPSHDKRDYAFAKKYGIAVKQVIAPSFLDNKNPPRKDAENTKRNIIHAIVINQSGDKFIALRNKKQPWLTPVTGGIEDGENIIEAGIREVKEETGYQNFELVKEMPYKLHAKFYAAHKKVNRSVFSNVLVFKLKDDKCLPLSKEEFEMHEVKWLPISKLESLHPVSELDEIVKWFNSDESFAYTGNGVLINSAEFNGMNNREAINEITKFLESKNLGRKATNYKLKDWLVSRQRYWGTPIPIIYCDKCGIVPVPENQLPISLPKEVKFGKGNPLLTSEKFVNAKCPKCNANAKRETDTMDTFFDSSWYYLRYPDNENNKEPFNKKTANYWLPVDQYIGGAEHACMHLIYARFFTKALWDLGFVDFDEPFTKLFNQGMLHGPDGEKMSKSKGNVILPEEVSKKYGIDTARLFLVSAASPDKDIDWSEKGIEGSLRFMKKIIDYFESVKIGKTDAKIQSKLNKTIKEVTNQIENFKYNLAVIKIRDLFNSLPNEISKEVLEKSLKLLSPFCPHISEELWQKLGNKNFISLSSWPKANESKINESLEKQEQAIEKLAGDINHIIKIMVEKNTNKLKKFNIIPKKDDWEKMLPIKKVYVYVLPNEKENFVSNQELISKKTNLDIKIFAVNDKEKYDPENKSKKVKPGRPGIYLE